MKTLHYILFSLIFFTAGTTSSIDGETIDMSNTTSDRTLNLSAIYDTIEYIKLETTQECVIGSIKKILPYSNRLYILDDMYSNIFVFDNNGHYLNSIGKKGTGPDEYIFIDDICIDNITERLFVLDNSQNRIQVYNLEGNFITSVKIEYSIGEIEYLKNNRILCYNDFKSVHALEKNNSRPLLTIIDIDKGKTVWSDEFISFNIEGQEVISPFSATSTNTEETLVFNILTSSIYNIDQTGIKQKFILDFGEKDRNNRIKHCETLNDKELTAYDVCTDCKFSPQYTMITSVFKERDFIFITAVNYLEGKQFFIKYDTLNQTQIYAKGISLFNNDIDYGLPFIPPISMFNGKSYGFIDAYSFHEAFINNTANDKLREMARNTTEEDNPIIFVAKLKL